MNECSFMFFALLLFFVVWEYLEIEVFLKKKSFFGVQGLTAKQKDVNYY